MPAENAAPIPRNVARAIVIKDEDVFFLAEHDGSVPAGNQDGFGLYYHDCRYLDGYEVRIAGTWPIPLAANADQGSLARFELTNPQLQTPEGHTVAEQTFGISVQRILDSGERAVHDRWTVVNYDVQEHALPLSFRFDAHFEDVFEIRGLHPKRSGKENPPRWDDDVLVLSYDGADGMRRALHIQFEPRPQAVSGSGAELKLRLAPGQTARFTLSLRIVESKEKAVRPGRRATDPAPIVHAMGRRAQDWLAGHAEVESDHPLLDKVVRRSLLDLLALRSSLEGLHYFSAGLPWYGTLFGRDSIVAALQTLAYEPSVAEQTLRLLAKYQGTKVDEWRDEEPGKILHELRRGELAHLNEIPQTPYYGSVDATPLFLILVGEHAHWTGDLRLFQELRPNVQRALEWIDTYGDEGRNGYLSYVTKSKKGLGNQGWKDSGDSVMNADGSLATAPIALVEVQGYVYRAKLLIADLYSRAGDEDTARRLRHQAADLKARFNRDFWVPEMDFYALALQKDERPAAVISSNPGQALWTGIVDHEHAASVVRRLMSPEMFSGWGVRTLSTAAPRANPIGYHLGTVWPHDNSVIAAGFRRHGFDREAAQVLTGMVEAASYFEHYRLPEVFAGFSRDEFRIPVRYPVACHPQAWAAGSVPFLLTSLLGLVADAFRGRLHIIRPVLPQGVDRIELRRVRLGQGSVDLRFRRKAGGGVEVETGPTDGLEVRLESGPQPQAA